MALITGAKPSAGKRFRIRLRIAFIAAENVGALDCHLASGAGRKHVSFVVKNCDLHLSSFSD
jgi:hypothetical protein